MVDTFCSGVESFKSINLYIVFMWTASISRKHCRDIVSISYYEKRVECLIHTPYMCCYYNIQVLENISFIKYIFQQFAKKIHFIKKIKSVVTWWIEQMNCP